MTSSDFQVKVQQSLRQDFTLEIGQVTESITITATGALLQVDNASLGTVVENESINELPLNGRNYLSLVALASNVNTLVACIRPGRRSPRRRSWQPVDLGRRPAHHVQLLHPGRREQYRS